MANSIEEPAYALLYNLGKVEIREYEPVIQAITTLPDNSATGAGFQRLAGFIFGGNSASESIAMTAPGTGDAEQRTTGHGIHPAQCLPHGSITTAQ